MTTQPHSIEAVLQEVNHLAIAEMQSLADRLEPLTKDAMESIRDQLSLRLAARLSEIEALRDMNFRKSERLQAALDVSSGFRAALKE